MDHTDDRIEQDIKDILKTRVAISDKLEMLEQRVEEKMERSRVAVKDLVDAARAYALIALDICSTPAE